MGNQLVGIAPSQIFNVEWYLKDHIDLKFDSSLGSTRFLKVAKAESQEGPVVVKVFAIHDPSLPLQLYKDQLEDIRKKLSSAVNCIPYQKFILTDKAALIIREYIKYSLYDRISTRPFLTDIEKRWITFQILYALHQCHKLGVCHGDIKLENITVTSWNWVLLVDFASFKPTFLPIDNPGDYSYYFDTARRRTCYIAPERFVCYSSTQSGSGSGSTESCCVPPQVMPDNSYCHPYGMLGSIGDLTPAMDIFSAGCALLELWNELHFPFDYAELLAYRAGKYSPQKHLDKLDDPNLRQLIASMIEMDPAKRLSAEHYLDKHRGTLFPEYFYTFLQSYMLIFSTNPIMSPDEKIARLKSDIGNIFSFLGPVRKASSMCESNGAVESANKQTQSQQQRQDEGNFVEERGECEGLVLITSLVTSCIRGLHECSSKLFCLEILLELAYHASDETILDRILPYTMCLAHDNSCRVKISAISNITKCLDLVTKLPRSDANIFPEYILLDLSSLATDPNTMVRVAYAKNISQLAEISLRFLEQIQNDWYGEKDSMLVTEEEEEDDEHPFNYEIELQVLHEMIEQTVSSLLTDSQSIVKQTLLNSGINKLCVFFGKTKANDVILSHMITFLNDKDDTQLRKSFFENIVGVASYVGWHCSTILTPLLLQGLTDSSEFVICKAINAMSALTEFNLISKALLCELVVECSHYLVHPNLWIRQAVAGFVVKAASTMNLIEVQCKIMPSLSRYMRYPVLQIKSCELMLDSLVTPIPRNVFDSIVSYADIGMLLEVLEDRKHIADCLRAGKVPSYDFYRDTIPSLKVLFVRLQANGLNEQIEGYILNMKHHIRKLNKHKVTAGTKSNKPKKDGKKEVDSLSCNTVRSRVFNLTDPHKGDYMANRALPRTNTLGSFDTNVNSEWNYSSEVLALRQSESTNSAGPSSSRSTSSRPSSPPTATAHADNHNNNQFISTTTDASSLHEKSYIQYRRTNCYIELNKLKSIQQDHYYEALRNKEWAEQAAWRPQLPPPGWHFKGVLVAHLHEHKSPVNKLCRILDTPLFTSCSADGSIRLWDCSKIEGKNIANRSKQHYRFVNSSGDGTATAPNNITGMAVCDNGQSLGACLKDGSVNVLRIDPTSSKMSLAQTRQLDPDEEGFAVEMQCLDSSSQSMLVYATLFGDIVGWDLRAPSIAWKLENGLQQGLLNTFCVDSQQSWLTLGTSDGYHTAWDLRFHLPITTIPNSSSSSSGVGVIKKVIPHPTEHSWIMSSVQGNNEISMWNLETGGRQKVLWGSTAPPLSKNSSQTSNNNHSARAMLAGCIDRAPFVMSGGTDQRVRFWNLESPSESYLAIPAANDPVGMSLAYRSRLIDGTDVIYQESTANARLKESTEEKPRSGPDSPPAGHKDCISDMILCKASQCFLVTSSRDGVIKVWK